MHSLIPSIIVSRLRLLLATVCKTLSSFVTLHSQLMEGATMTSCTSDTSETSKTLGRSVNLRLQFNNLINAHLDMNLKVYVTIHRRALSTFR